ncbi:hypothetical protein NDU88_009508 [Pleurodeles waltl]|uniref:Uncharacterized protein n=1 Tax=Pleurodeles waltl TaxID=8319 RepID=A0AAV7P3H6_PLEWA|nr:hypothetical protein NDU88_009508 [Pleurodeles waltl]
MRLQRFIRCEVRGLLVQLPRAYNEELLTARASRNIQKADKYLTKMLGNSNVCLRASAVLCRWLSCVKPPGHCRRDTTAPAVTLTLGCPVSNHRDTAVRTVQLPPPPGIFSRTPLLQPLSFQKPPGLFSRTPARIEGNENPWVLGWWQRLRGTDPHRQWRVISIEELY